ncbi:hypothetical protein PHLCEN_2v935 [Hermanssonia centrifuga]|uniref:DUF7770 domain-containing protein n=1 Tax=Hermanssonia centrifuga TaxID=98765 RepID=A0A2R6S4J5_9APHY|nr:hypothetical protein PHLCEN_2v935 [Hermanssonia centrifuga]
MEVQPEINIKKDDRDTEILRIIVSGIPTQAVAEGRPSVPLIHWRIEAVLQHCATVNPNHHYESGVAFDTALRPDVVASPFIQMQAFSHQGAKSRSSKFHPDFNVLVRGWTPMQMLEDLKTANEPLHRYRYDGESSGCLYWCKRVLTRLEEIKKIPAGSAQRLDDVVQEARIAHANIYWIPEDRGSFY